MRTTTRLLIAVLVVGSTVALATGGAGAMEGAKQRAQANGVATVDLQDGTAGPDVAWSVGNDEGIVYRDDSGDETSVFRHDGGEPSVFGDRVTPIGTLLAR